MSRTTDTPPIDQVRPEHHRLGVIFEETAANLEAGEGRVACNELREALEAHFGQEEVLYYPTLWKLHPEQESKLRALIAAHKGLLVELDRIIDLLEGGDSAQVRISFEGLREQFAGHERAEETLLLSMS